MLSFSSSTFSSLPPALGPSNAVVAGMQVACFLLPPVLPGLLSDPLDRAQGCVAEGCRLPRCFSLPTLSTSISGKEFFFLDPETRLCKIAPEGWSEQPRKKTSSDAFTLFLRIDLVDWIPI